jgi:hypothetical protein
MDMKEVAKFETPAKTLKLSEAMRIGARIRPQCTGCFFSEGRSCAIGAAYEARTGRMVAYPASDPVQREFPELFDHPGHFSELGVAIYRRNDRGDTREQIADWLESKGY